MRGGICFLLLIAGLSGCASRNPGSRRELRSFRDSISYTQLDTSCLHYNRGLQLRGWSRLKEVSLSVPDSTGKQYVERIVYATEEWGMADSTGLVSVSANTVNEQGVTSSVSVEQEVTRRKTSRIVWWILILVLIILICLLRKLRRIK